VVSVASKPSGALWEQAQAILKAKAARAKERAIARAERPVPNIICYAETAFKGWVPGMKLPKCERCEGILFPNENHDCPVKSGTEEFQRKYVEHTPERRERWEARREEIRESRREGQGVFCSECNQLLDCPEDAEWHFEDHGGKPERNHCAIDGEPDGDLDGYDDDLTGYEDEPEEDHCEGDDDGL
jgi:hypothetical protein